MIEMESDPEEEEEARRPKGLSEPRKPSLKEIEEHNLTHLPFRNWCPYCVQGGAPNRNHVKLGEVIREIPHISCDYCFMGDREDDETLIIQVAKDDESKSVFVHAVPRK